MRSPDRRVVFERAALPTRQEVRQSKHTLLAPSLVIVKTGALTLYRGDDPDCTPHVVAAGHGFVDDGGDVHLVRNEGSIDTVVYVTSLVPKGAERRIDEPSPGNCPV